MKKLLGKCFRKIIFDEIEVPREYARQDVPAHEKTRKGHEKILAVMEGTEDSQLK